VKILLCASEIVPFAKTGGLADVAGALPKVLAAQKHDIRIVLPKYASVDEKRFKAKKVVEKLKVPIGDKMEEATIWLSEEIAGVSAYFVEHAGYFGQGPLYGQWNDAARFIFYQRAILAMLPALNWQPEVIHCNDWQSGLIPLYVHMARDKSGPLGKTATVYTVHNLGYQGNFPKEDLKLAGLPDSYFTPEKLEFYGNVNLMKSGLLYADIITTVSPTYAKEIQSAEYGYRLEGVIAMRSKRLRGILNGIDYDVWNPAADRHIAKSYSATSPSGKAACKKALQARLKLAQGKMPIIALVSRLAAQKGFDLLEQLLPYLLKMNVQLVVLGLGEKPYEDLFKKAAKDYPDRVSISLEFNEELAHQIYAGADMFLMPSRYEPCGLGQLISLRYGTVPIVRATGGLADTVEDFNSIKGKGNGFSFAEYSSVALMGTLARALLTYEDRAAWKQLMEKGLKEDHSWQSSAKEYVKAYKEAISLLPGQTPRKKTG